MRTAFVRALIEQADRDDRIVLLTADLGFMALEPFRDRFPDRFFNVGVAEQNMIGMATGLAEAGFRPYCYSIVPFAVLRPFEFFRNGPVIHGLPVTVVGMGGGFEYGTAGPTHYGIEDVGAMRLLPDVAIIAPADADQTVTAVEALSHWSGPAYLRLGKNDKMRVPNLNGRFELGRTQQVRDGRDVVIFTLGSIAASVVEAAELLTDDGISAAVVVLASISPCPYEDLVSILALHPTAMTVEAHALSGGIGSLVAEVIAQDGLSCRLIRVGVEHPYGGPGGSEAFLHDRHGLSPSAVRDRVLQAVAGVVV